MYPIGLFSKMNRVSAKTLRHYDEIGLLKPAYVDEENGYRYYSSDQFARLSKIITLKQMGLPLRDILVMIDNDKSVEIFLRVQENDLLNRISEEQIKLSHVRNYLKRMKGECIMKYNPIIKSLPECIVASMRFKAESYDSYFDRIPKMGKEMERLGAVCAEPEYCFNIYHDGEYKDKNIDVEVCEAVVDYCKDSDMVKFKKIEAVEEALCIFHKGAYSLFAEAYKFAYEWIEDNGYEVVGLARESYIDGIWNKESEEEWLTEIQIPIGKK